MRILSQKIKNEIIKFLGGYTAKEYERSQQRYQGLLDSITDNNCARIANEYIYYFIRDLINFAKNDLYGNPSDTWAQRMWHTLYNNMYRVLVRYIQMGSGVIYKLDTTLDTPDAFKHVLEDDGNVEALELYRKANPYTK